MMKQRKRLFLCVALVLICALVLPVFAGCAKEEADAPATTAEEAFKENTEEKVPTEDAAPEAPQINPNAESLQSTPNKGGNKQVTSGTYSTKSVYSAAVELAAAELAGFNQHKIDTAAARRDYVEAYMRAMLTVEWTVDTRPDDRRADIDGKVYYREDYDSESEWDEATEDCFDQDEFTYRVGKFTFPLYTDRQYRGIPYSNGDSGLETFMSFVGETDEDGVHHMSSEFDVRHMFGGQAIARVGVDYFNAIMYAWNTVSGSVYGSATSHAVPVNGFIPVGGYEIPVMDEGDRNALAPKPPVESDAAIGNQVDENLSIFGDNSAAGDTDDIVEHNGPEKMFAAYAATQKADMLLRDDADADDAMMVVSVNVVYDKSGAIDGDASYVTVHHQTADNAHKTNTEVDDDGFYYFGDVDKKVTFRELFDNNFIPFTITELEEGAPLSAAPSARDSIQYTSRHNHSYMYSGVLTANRRVVWANAVLTDSKGNVVFDSIAFAERGDMRMDSQRRYTFDVTKLDDSYEKEVGHGIRPVATSKLTVGEKYHYVITLRLATGEEIVARDWTFTR